MFNPFRSLQTPFRKRPAINKTVVVGYLCLLIFGCSSYPPYHYRFSLIEPLDKSRPNDVVGQAMIFEDQDIQFRFVPSADNIRVAIRNKTDRGISLVRSKAEYINHLGESRSIHYGYDYVEEVLDFVREHRRHVTPLNIDPEAEIDGYVWINNWPDFRIGQGPGNTPISSPNIINLKEPFFPRYSFEGKGEDLKGSMFNLILPIDFGDYVRSYMFTFTITEVM